MARARNIKPAIMDNDQLADCEPAARLLFVYLWMLADRKGRLEDRPRRIKAQAFPYDEFDVDPLLQQLHDQRFILRYELGNKKYIQVTNFTKHQSPCRNEKESKIPEPEGFSTPTTVPIEDKSNTSKGQSRNKTSTSSVQGQNKPDTKTVAVPPDYMNKDIMNENCSTPEVGISNCGSRLPNNWELPNEFYLEAQTLKPNWSPEKIKTTGDTFKDYWIAKPGNQGVKLDWLATWRNWVRRDWDTPGTKEFSNGSEVLNSAKGARKEFPFGSES